MLHSLSLYTIAYVKSDLFVTALQSLMRLTIIKFVYCISVIIFVFLFINLTARNSGNDNKGIYSNTNEKNSAVPQACNVNTVPVLFGEIDPNRKYAVFSTTSNEDKQTYDFIFLLPLTAIAWRRVGFDSLVIVVGSVTAWTFDPLLYNVLARLRQVNAVIIFLNVPPVNSVMVSQVRMCCFQGSGEGFTDALPIFKIVRIK